MSTWREDNNFRPVRSEFRQQLAAVAQSGAVHRVGSFDDFETLVSVTVWVALAGAVKERALTTRDEFLALVALRIQLGLAHIPAKEAAQYLHLSVREGKEMDRLIAKYLERPLRFPTKNYYQPFKKAGDGRKRPKKGWAAEVIRREQYYGRDGNRPKLFPPNNLDKKSVSLTPSLGEGELNVEYLQRELGTDQFGAD